MLDLPQTISGSGARYSDGATPETVFWNKGENATLTLKGRDLPECVPMIDPPLLPLTARGNEPFWSLDLSDEGYVFRPNLDVAEQRGPLTAPVTVDEGLRFDLSEVLSVLIERRICRDTMAGMPFPLTVTASSGEQVLRGCGGAPVDLLAGPWTGRACRRRGAARGVRGQPGLRRGRGSRLWQERLQPLQRGASP